MRIGIVGCGYVADFYLATLQNHPELELAGVVDRDGERARRLAAARGTSITISADGPDEDAAVGALSALVERGFDEDHACSS